MQTIEPQVRRMGGMEARRDPYRDGSRNRDPLQRLLVSVLTSVGGAGISYIDQSTVIRLDGPPHIENGDSIVADRQPIAAQRPYLPEHLRAGHFAAGHVNVDAQPFRYRTNGLAFTEFRGVRHDVFE